MAIVLPRYYYQHWVHVILQEHEVLKKPELEYALLLYLRIVNILSNDTKIILFNTSIWSQLKNQDQIQSPIIAMIYVVRFVIVPNYHATTSMKSNRW